jgi:hypothetical protein
MYIYVHIYTPIHMCIYTSYSYTCMRIYKYIYKYLHVFLYTCICTDRFIHKFMYINIGRLRTIANFIPQYSVLADIGIFISANTYLYAYTYIYVDINVYGYTFVYIVIYLYIHIRTYTYIYIYINIYIQIFIYVYIGCDHGRLSVGLSGHCSHVYAIDVSPRAIQGCIYKYMCIFIHNTFIYISTYIYKMMMT